MEVKEAHVKFPNLPVPKSSDGDVSFLAMLPRMSGLIIGLVQQSWVIRLPNFVSVDTKPFHPDTYMGPEQEDEDLQGDNIREKSMTVKLRVENTLRWRWTKDENGQDVRGLTSLQKKNYPFLIFGFNHRNENQTRESSAGQTEP